MKKQLLIVGNGFDLYCGLKSTFNDYILKNIEHKKAHVVMNILTNIVDEDSNIGDSVIERNYKEFSKLSYLEILMYGICVSHGLKPDNGGFLWSDIEKIIGDLFVSKQNDALTIEILEFISKVNIDYFSFKNGNAMTLKEVLIKIFIEGFAKGDNHIFVPAKKAIANVENWYSYLENQLIEFESDFCNYLINELNEKKEYHESAENLFKLISQNTKTCILSFNYTPIKFLSENEYANVHGSLEDKDIVIGIDSTNIEYNDLAYRFTKTYKKVKHLINKGKEANKDILDNDYDIISFFGHSLSEQDYAYFQTIFDKYDLYSGNIQLRFYFSIYDDKIEENIKKNQMTSIIKLVDTYAKTINNKYQGKNLLHKLINENRLQIINISDVVVSHISQIQTFNIKY